MVHGSPLADEFGIDDPEFSGAGDGAESDGAKSRRRLPDGWPLLTIFWGYPITWALGFGPFVVLILAIPMAVELSRRRPIVVPRGARAFFLFLVFLAASVVMLTAQPPGALKSTVLGLSLGYLYRGASWIAGIIIALYVTNMTERELPTMKVVRAMAALFVITIIGGYFGMLVPYGQFTSPVETLLPHVLTHNNFVHQLVHPASSEVQRFLGFSEARPKAPFEYTNEWGGNFSLLLPFYLLAWRRSTNVRFRRWGWVALVVAVPPVIYSLNRGLWLALMLIVALGALHLLRQGRIMAVIAGAGVAVVAVAAFVISPLYSLTLDRVHHPNSNAGRSFVYQLAVQGAEASPLLGWGGPRSSEGSDQSIARGVSAKCPTCGGVPIGTHGTVWLVVFSEGFLALGLLGVFLVSALMRVGRRRDDLSFAVALTLAVFIFEAFIYNQLPTSFAIAMCALGLAWRSELSGRRQPNGPRWRVASTWSRDLAWENTAAWDGVRIDNRAAWETAAELDTAPARPSAKRR